MLSVIDWVLKILFLITSIIWASKIMVLRTDRQIVITPLLIILAAIIIALPSSSKDIIFKIRIVLYCLYLMIVTIGLYAIHKRKI